MLKPLEREPEDALRCAFCDSVMQALLGEPFHLCVNHGMWFDRDERHSFVRGLRVEIARHRATRLQRLSITPMQEVEDGRELN
jgi:hypothetical protein